MPVVNHDRFHRAFVRRFENTPPFLYNPTDEELAAVAAKLTWKDN